MIKAIVKAVSAAVCWFFSERRAKAKEKSERLKLADEVASGDEEKINARLSKLPVLFAAVFVLFSGCTFERTVYVREGDRAIALKPGGVHTNTGDTVEWILPRGVMTRLLNAAEAK